MRRTQSTTTMAQSSAAAPEKSERRSVLDVGENFGVPLSAYRLSNPIALGTPGCSEPSIDLPADASSVHCGLDCLDYSAPHERVHRPRAGLASVDDQNGEKDKEDKDSATPITTKQTEHFGRAGYEPEWCRCGESASEYGSMDAAIENAEIAVEFLKLHRQIGRLEDRVRAALCLPELWDLRINGGQTRCCPQDHK